MTERDELVERLRVSAKLLRSASAGIVGEDRHWMKDCATDCENGAELIEHSASREAALCAAANEMRERATIAFLQPSNALAQLRAKDAILAYDSTISDTSPAASRLLKIESAFRELTRTARLDLNANQADEMPGNWSLQHERAVVAAEALLTGASK